MSRVSNISDYGIVDDEFVVKDASAILLDMIERAKAVFGDDIDVSSANMLIAFMETLAIEGDISWQKMAAVFQQIFPDTATGPFLSRIAEDRGLDRQSAVKATTTLRFDRSGAAIATVPVGTEIDNNGDIKFLTTEAVVFPEAFEMERGQTLVDDVSSQQDAYQYFRDLQSVSYCSSASNGTGTVYIEGTDFANYTAGDDEITWENAVVGTPAEPAGAAWYAVVIDVIFKMENHITGGADIYAAKMADQNILNFATSGPGGGADADLDNGVAPVQYYQVRWVADSYDANYNASGAYTTVADYDVTTSSLQIDWAGAASQPAASADYYMRVLYQKWVQRGGTANTADTLISSIDTSTVVVDISQELIVLAGGVIYANGSEYTGVAGIVLDDQWPNAAGSTDYLEGISANSTREWVEFVTYVYSTTTASWTGNNSIDWSPVGRPAQGATYYVDFAGVSADIESEAENAGTSYNLIAGQLNNQTSPISGITTVTNESDVVDGTDLETDAELRNRIKSTIYARKNDITVAADIANLPIVRACKIEENNNSEVGTFITVVDFLNTDNNASPSSKSYKTVVEEVQKRKTIGSADCVILRILRTTDSFENFPSPHTEVNRILWVSDSATGTSAYSAGTDYEFYVDGDNKINWVTGGGDPGAGNYYYIKVIGAVYPADVITVDPTFFARLASGETEASATTEVSNVLTAYMRNKQIDDDLYYSEFVDTIVGVSSVQSIDDLRLGVILKLTRGAGAGGFDLIPSEYVESISWINTERSQEGTGYSYVDDYFINLTGITIEMDVGAVAATCQIRITDNRLRIYEAGTLSATVGFDFDLTNPLYNTMSKIVALIDADGEYTASNVAAVDNVNSALLIPIEIPDCKVGGGGTQTLQFRGVIDWSPGGVEPTAATYYYAYIIIKGSLTVGAWEVLKLGSVSLTETS